MINMRETLLPGLLGDVLLLYAEAEDGEGAP